VRWRELDLADVDLELLTDRQRIVVVLAVRMSQREAADYLQISRSTLRSHLEDAARRLGLTGAA
jgi:DNA-binding CsgD family transcriptional regulator